MKIQLLLTGDELLTGDIVDTNSTFIASAFNDIGLRIAKKTTVGDDLETLIAEIKSASQQFDLLLINGGLGPTVDDLTAAALAKVCDVDLSEHAGAKEHLISWCQKKHIALTPANLKQAMLPENCDIIANDIGSAVGIDLTAEGCRILATPGVPSELYQMINQHILPFLESRSGQSPHIERFHLFGMGESQLQQRITDEIQNWPSFLNLGFRAAKPTLEVKISYQRELSEDKIAPWRTALLNIVADYHLGSDSSLSHCVQKALLTANKTITTAESCTGGLIASMITKNPGSSAVFEAGYVTYSNDIKHRTIDVGKETLEKHGAVSEQVVMEMAKGALRASGSDYVIAVSGVAGPGGGSKEKPVGTVWIAWGHAENIKAVGLIIPTDRVAFQHYVANIGLDLIRRELMRIENEPEYIGQRAIKNIKPS